MTRSTLISALQSLGVLVLSAGAYWLVLNGVVPFGLETPFVFAALAGATALGAVLVDARIPALTAAVAASGFALASARLEGLVSGGDTAILVGAGLATLGVLGYALSMTYTVGTRVYGAYST